MVVLSQEDRVIPPVPKGRNENSPALQCWDIRCHAVRSEYVFGVNPKGLNVHSSGRQPGDRTVINIPTAKRLNPSGRIGGIVSFQFRLCAMFNRLRGWHHLALAIAGLRPELCTLKPSGFSGLHDALDEDRQYPARAVERTDFWPQPRRSNLELFSFRRFATLIYFFAVVLLAGCSREEKKFVVLYTSQDQFYAEPILKEFTDKTGIEVRSVFDTESAKTAGLAHRLRAEARSSPQCDVFWSNEEMHTRQLVNAGVLDEKGWKMTGSRTRRLVINTNLLANDKIPASLLELTNRVWNGRVALAYPLFGTTKAHFVALRQLWGEELWKAWCYGLVRNGAKVVDGNSVVVKLVAAGECAIGLTDSDDIAAAVKEGKPVAALQPTGEFIAIPSTVALVRDAPHPDTARALLEFLSAPETVQRLVTVHALESVEAKPNFPQLLTVNWAEAIKDAQAAADFLEMIFVRS